MIARDINRHAAVVLQGTPEGLADLDGSSGAGDRTAAKKGQDTETARIAQALAEQQKQTAAAAGSSSAASGSGGGKEDSVSPEQLAEWQERAASALEDLTLDEREKQYAPLNIQDPRAYFDAGAAAGGAADGKPGAAKQKASAAAAGLAAGRPAAALVAALAAVQPLALPDPPCDPAVASEVLLELGQGQDEALVAEFGPVAATALQYPPHDRTHGLPALLLVSGTDGVGQGWEAWAVHLRGVLQPAAWALVRFTIKPSCDNLFHSMQLFTGAPARRGAKDQRAAAPPVGRAAAGVSCTRRQGSQARTAPGGAAGAAAQPHGRTPGWANLSCTAGSSLMMTHSYARCCLVTLRRMLLDCASVRGAGCCLAALACSHCIVPLPTAAGTSQQVYVSMMLRPLAAAIDAALARYQQEQQARQRQQAAKAPP